MNEQLRNSVYLSHLSLGNKLQALILGPRPLESRSKALSVNNVCPILAPLLLRYPHLLEARQACQDASAAENAVPTILWSADFDLHGGGRQAPHVLLKTLLEAWVHGGAAADDDVVVKVLREA
jgi:hypothetical protein